TQANESVLNAGSGQIDLNANGDITVGSLVTNNAGDDAITITSTAGAVVDGGDTDIDLIADAVGAIVDIDAANGIGNGDALETKIAAVEATNGTAGNIELSESGALLINNITQTAAGSIAITSNGAVTVVTALGGVTAAGDAETIVIEVKNGSSLTINDGVTSNNGDISLTAADDVIFGVDGDVSSTNGDVVIIADADLGGNGSSGALTMGNGTEIDAGTGNISLKADENITLGRIVTTGINATVSIISTSAGVVDGGDTNGEDIDADGAGAFTSVRTVTGFGIAPTSGANVHIEVDLDTLTIVNSGQGDINVTETDNVTIDDGDIVLNDGIFNQDGDFNINAGVNVTVNDHIQIRGDVDMSGVANDVVIIRNLGIFARGTINLRVGNTLVSDADGVTENLAINPDTGGIIILGNVGRPNEELNLLISQDTADINLNTSSISGDQSGTIRISGNMIFDGTGFDGRAAQQFILDGDANITTANGRILFSDTPINDSNVGQNTLTLNSGTGPVDLSNVGTTVFVGDPADGIEDIRGVPLGGLSITGGLVRLNESIATQSVGGGDGGDITIVSSNTIKLEDNLTISSGNGDIDLDQAVINGNFDLRIDSGTGNVELTNIGQTVRLNSLTVVSTGTTFLGASLLGATPIAISTVNNQDFGGATDVDLRGNLTSDSTAGNLLFTGGDIDGAFNAVFRALQGAVNLDNIGRTTPITLLDIDANSTTLTGSENVDGTIDIDVRSLANIFADVRALGGSEILIDVDDALSGALILQPGSTIISSGGNLKIRAPFNNLVTRGDLFAPGNGFEFFNLTGLSSFQFDAEELHSGLIPLVTFDAFFMNPVIFHQFMNESLQWKETIMPTGAIRAEKSTVKFDEEEDQEDE
ncbi:MAG: hypothetical protein O2857_26660, partial [Planctomycetota bacterium]|nr:hypothetical protein [Planctomycetota bacterium]